MGDTLIFHYRREQWPKRSIQIMALVLPPTLRKGLGYGEYLWKWDVGLEKGNNFYSRRTIGQVAWGAYRTEQCQGFGLDN